MSFLFVFPLFSPDFLHNSAEEEKSENGNKRIKKDFFD